MATPKPSIVNIMIDTVGIQGRLRIGVKPGSSKWLP